MKRLATNPQGVCKYYHRCMECGWYIGHNLLVKYEGDCPNCGHEVPENWADLDADALRWLYKRTRPDGHAVARLTAARPTTPKVDVSDEEGGLVWCQPAMAPRTHYRAGRVIAVTDDGVRLGPPDADPDWDDSIEAKWLLTAEIVLPAEWIKEKIR